MKLDPSVQDVMPCIRCGDCADICPAQLQPHELLQKIKLQDYRSTEQLGVFDCTECGHCDLVCPSHIALTAQFKNAKINIRERKHIKASADQARIRYQRRIQRLLNEKQQLEQKRLQTKTSVISSAAAAIAKAKAAKADHKSDESS